MRQAGEQYVAESGRSTLTIQDAPHSGQLAFTASVLARARRIRRQCRERHVDEQKTAVTFADGISGEPHPRHNRGPVPSSATTTSLSRGVPSLPIQAPYSWCQVAPTPLLRANPGLRTLRLWELCAALLLGRPRRAWVLPGASPGPPMTWRTPVSVTARSLLGVQDAGDGLPGRRTGRYHGAQ
uniref:hypothetical protein n=1 Tax=Streptomyces sp. NBC_01562 TaxID=2975879 RepID=UPI002F9091FF